MALASPTIIDATAFGLAGSFVDTIILWANSGGQGYVKFEAIKDGSIISTLERCPAANTGPLFNRTVLPADTPPPIHVDVKGYKCDSDTEQNCTPTPPTCSSKVQTTSRTDIAVRLHDTTAPGVPTGLNITPGDGNLRLQWNAPTNVDIFAYYVVVELDGVLKTSGSTIKRDITLDNLVNGKTYDIQIKAVSHSNVAGSAATGSGTPEAPEVLCPDLQTNLTVGD